jgi:lipid A disaccharide synthetase
MANLLLHREAWPEYLQSDCEPEALAERLKVCLQDGEMGTLAAKDAAALHTILSAKPGSTPVDWLLTYLKP